MPCAGAIAFTRMPESAEVQGQPADEAVYAGLRWRCRARMLW